MTFVRPVLVCLALVVLPVAGHATRVYQSKGPDGSAVFSDRPSEQAREIEIDLPAAKPPAAAPVAAPGPSESEPDPNADKVVAYKTLRITQPADDAVVWFAEGPVTVNVEISPPLAKGHLLIPLLNGVAQGAGVAANGFSLTDLDPDTYQLAVAIRDAAGKTLKKSPSIQFHFKRQSVNLPARRPPPRSGN
jgi:hypothetical protein